MGAQAERLRIPADERVLSRQLRVPCLWRSASRAQVLQQVPEAGERVPLSGRHQLSRQTRGRRRLAAVDGGRRQLAARRRCYAAGSALPPPPAPPSNAASATSNTSVRNVIPLSFITSRYSAGRVGGRVD